MPNKHKNRFTQDFGHRQTTGLLVNASDIANENPEIFQHDRENIVSRMTTGARLEAQGIMRDRFDTASPQTEDMKNLMDQLDKQDEGLFHDDMGDNEERFFLPKSREDLDIIFAFILDTVTQLRPLVVMEPKITTMMNATEDFQKAKIAELLIQFYFNDVWKIVDVQFPIWLRHFLMYPQALYKVSYFESTYDADLLLDVVDRALMYFDPAAKRVHDAQWIFERYFVPKHEVMERVDRGDWVIPKDDKGNFEGHMSVGNTEDSELDRFLGNQNYNLPSVEADEYVEVIDYWQYPRKGLGDLYAVMVGGIEGSLVRYGRNFNPYKYNQFISSAYRQKDRPDGMSLTQEIRPFQKIINSWVNLRNDDVLANVQAANLVDGDLIDAETQAALEAGERLIPAAPEVAKAIRNAGGKLEDSMAPFPSGTSTDKLLQMDLPFILNQRQESSHISDVFRGGSPPPGTPLGIVQEQLTRNAGAFKPVIRQVMLPFERMAEIMLEYHKSEEFFPEERVVSIIGKNKYANVISGWQVIGDDVQAVGVTPDMMPTDVRFNAISGADAFAARTMLNSTIANLLQGLGQNPELIGIIKEDFNFSALWEHLLNVSGLDIDRLKFTPEQKQQRAQQQQQAEQKQMQQLQQQQQMAQQMEQATEQFKAQMQMQIEQTKQQARAQSQVSIDTSKITGQNEADLEQIVTKILRQSLADEMLEVLKSDETQKQMRLEGKLEKDNQVTNVSPSGGQNVQAKQ